MEDLLPDLGPGPSSPQGFVSPTVDYLQNHPQDGCEPSGLTCPSTCSGGILDPAAAEPQEPEHQPRAPLAGSQGRDGDFPGSTIWDYETSLP